MYTYFKVKNTYPIHITKELKEQHHNLLLFSNENIPDENDENDNEELQQNIETNEDNIIYHYAYIKNLSALLCTRNGRDHKNIIVSFV